MKKLRREESDDWRLVRKVFWNSMLQARYQNMKERLFKTGKTEAFGMVKQLEGRRAIAPMKSLNGGTVFEHDKISDMMAEQLGQGCEKEKEVEEVDVMADMEDLRIALKERPPNMAGGIDKMGYPFQRFW